MHAGTGPLFGPGQYIHRKLPGHSWKKNGEVIFIKGKVLHSGWGKLGSSTQLIQTNSKLVGLAQLCGHNYIYWCDFCKITIFEQEMLITKQTRSASVDKQRVCSVTARFYQCSLEPRYDCITGLLLVLRVREFQRLVGVDGGRRSGNDTTYRVTRIHKNQCLALGRSGRA